MLNEALQLYNAFVAVFPTGTTIREQMKRYYIIGYGLPIIVVIVSVGMKLDNYVTSQFCWIDGGSTLIWAFLGPAAAVICINIILWLLVLREILKCGGTLIALKACVSLGILIGVTWLFGLLVAATNQIVFQFFFAICNAFQGVRLMSLVLGEAVESLECRCSGGTIETEVLVEIYCKCHVSHIPLSSFPCLGIYLLLPLLEITRYATSSLPLSTSGKF